MAGSFHSILLRFVSPILSMILLSLSVLAIELFLKAGYSLSYYSSISGLVADLFDFDRLRVGRFWVLF